MSVRFVLVCDGAAYFDDGSPDYGTFKCTKTLPTKAAEAFDDKAELLERARAASWRMGPRGDVMCPDCAKPDPRTLRLIEAFGAKQRTAS